MNEEIILQFRKELQNLGYCKTVINSYPKQIAKFLRYIRKENFEVQSKDILDYYSYLKTVISPRTKNPLSDNYLHTILLAIKLYFDYLQRTGTIKINPYQLKIKAPKSEERKVFTNEEIKKLYAKSSKLQVIILHLCYACGLRRTEAVNLLLKDIDLENNLLYIRKGKGKKRRVIPFTRQVQKDIKDFIFSNEKGEYLLNITAERIYIEFKYLLKKTGLNNQGFTLHCLRHTIATQLLEQGMELEKVRDFLGHEYLGTTQIYTRINYGTGKLSAK
ncbi:MULTISPECIES: tyrosine-type recombinase/integrase [Chryseobacterium]|nr:MULTISPECIES: tyrosine-type recombinase/integrase [Chryseobacterium]QQV02459.1 tyrosine-type recombinase/integrase [Chryseobacterium sp. FDAARGOS 1104]QQV02465.1 tyrosine-type recombinase/integrase [Chryseobacterium sp. FDAARGOS 1104]QQV02471.1 tyrosine-type recombinase/integrase [Chryseobacterium sp. FDAARGOS 1104]QQV02477.1 tyrosine-type recombinase/integrase [Chryseobacterium sp. FDAARGOS 1104]